MKLGTMLEGDAGGDEKEIELSLKSVYPAFQIDKSALAALSRLSVKARLSEAEKNKAKREVLEKVRLALQVEPDMFDFIDQQLAQIGGEKNGS